MSDHIVRPVLKRANSVKQIGTVASSYATNRIDGAINVADQYVDKYFPSEDATDSEDLLRKLKFLQIISLLVGCEPTNSQDMSKAVHTFQRGKDD